MRHAIRLAALVLALILPGELVRTKERPYELVIQNGHFSRVWAVQYSKDGRFFATGSHDNTVKLWSADGFLLRTLASETATTGFVYDVAIHPDGTSLIAAGDGSLRLFGTDGSLIKKIDLWGGVYAAAASPDGAGFASGHMDTKVRTWDRSGAPLQELTGHSGQVYGLAYSPDSRLLASSSQDRTVRLWDRSGKTVGTLAGHGAAVQAVAFSPDGTMIATGSDDMTIRLWTAAGQPVRILRGHRGSVRDVAFSPDGRMILSASEDGAVRLWDLDGSTVRSYTGLHGAAYCAAMSPDGKRLVAGTGVDDTNPAALRGRNELVLWDLKGTELRRMRGYADRVNLAVFAPDGKTVAAASGDNRAHLWNIDGSLRAIYTGHTREITAMAVNATDGTIASGSRDSSIHLWRSDGTPVTVLRGHAGSILDLAFHPGDGTLISLGGDQSIRLWRRDGSPAKKFSFPFPNITSLAWRDDGKSFIAASDRAVVEFAPDGSLSTVAYRRDDQDRFEAYLKELERARGLRVPERDWSIKIVKNQIKLRNRDNRTLRTLEGHLNDVTSARFSRDGRALVSTSADTSVRIWNTETGESMTLVCFINGEWFMGNDAGFWDGSRGSGRHVAMVRGLQAWGVDQFALRNNRPDMVLHALGLMDKECILHFYAQFKRRLKQAGFSEGDLSDALHVPRATIERLEHQGKNATISFTLSDSEYALRTYNIYVNDVPLHGAYGRSIKGKETSLTESLELTQGENKIEVACVNVKGVESLRALATARSEAPSRGELYFLGFGVSEYANSSLNLKYAHQDAQDLSKLFAAMGTRFTRIRTTTFVNREVTVAAIRDARSFIAAARPDDTVVLFIAGHGVHAADDAAAYYYLTHDADAANLAGTAADFSLIEELLQGTAARQKLFLMDTCESGQRDDEAVSDDPLDTGARGLKARTTRGLTIINRKNRKGKDRTWLLERNRYIYNDLIRRSGAIVFSSSRGNEYSFEKDEYANGLFTEEILKGLRGRADANRDTWISIDELRGYVVDAVPKISGNRQHPTVDRDNIYIRFGFPVVP